MEAQEKLVKLHPEIKEISFKHKSAIERIYQPNILELFGLDYFSLMLVDAQDILTLYSSDPSLEYNLIQKNLWRHDGVFNTENHIDGAFQFWDALYEPNFYNILIQDKERKFGYQFGFYLMKALKAHFAIYSYATQKSKDRAFYQQSQPMLNKMGDYFYEGLIKIHRQYTNTNHKLKLIIDNTIGSKV